MTMLSTEVPNKEISPFLKKGNCMYSLAVAHARGDSHIKRTKTVLVAFRLLSLKRSTARPFPIPLRVLSETNMTGDNVLCKNWYLFKEL